MSKNTFQMNRRTMLKAAGISLALPWMESLAAHAASATPRRFCSIYFPYGVSLPSQDGETGHWHWFPKGEGKDFTFNKSLQPLEAWRDQVTVLGGLSHPKVRRIGGHDSGDTFLTGEEMSLGATGLKNSISLDQYMARTHRLGAKTSFTSLIGSHNKTLGLGIKGQHGLKVLCSLCQILLVIMIPAETIEDTFLEVGFLDFRQDSGQALNGLIILAILKFQLRQFKGNILNKGTLEELI